METKINNEILTITNRNLSQPDVEISIKGEWSEDEMFELISKELQSVADYFYADELEIDEEAEKVLEEMRRLNFDFIQYYSVNGQGYFSPEDLIKYAGDKMILNDEDGKIPETLDEAIYAIENILRKSVEVKR